MNNTITLLYSWQNGDATNANNLTQILAQHSDGQALTLTFGEVAGARVLSTVARPDGASVTYYYDSFGNLKDVYALSNNASGSQPHYRYIYGANGQSTHELTWMD